MGDSAARERMGRARAPRIGNAGLPYVGIDWAPLPSRRCCVASWQTYLHRNPSAAIGADRRRKYVCQSWQTYLVVGKRTPAAAGRAFANGRGIIAALSGWPAAESRTAI